MSLSEIYLFVIGDQEGGDESVMMWFNEQKREWVPLIAANKEVASNLMCLADQIKEQIGKPYRVLHFQLVGITRKGETLQ